MRAVRRAFRLPSSVRTALDATMPISAVKGGTALPATTVAFRISR